MKFDSHTINCEIRCDPGFRGSAACCDGKIGPLWKRMEAMAKSRKITGWTFWVTLRRGPIEIQAHGSDMTYAEVERKAERILLASEAAFSAEHNTALTPAE